MFTGIITDIGEIVSIDKTGDWTLTIATGKLSLDKMAIGASVACNGVCLTVIEKLPAAQARGSNRDRFKVRVSAETLSCTTAMHWKPGMRINLEPALHLGDELGGHLVLGHIDGLAQLKEKHKDGDSVRYLFEVPGEFAKFIASKGSIALDGVALTVNEVKGSRFGVNIIPHTLAETTFGVLEPGSEVNFEIDLMARYAERLLNQKAAS